MNLIFMKTKVDHLNGCWEPHATSTPLKKIPPKLDIKIKAQDRVLILKDSVNVPGKIQNARNAFGIFQEQPVEKTKCVNSKRNRKGRLSTYFDPSSSSEDESGEIKKRPIIKLGSKETNERLLKNKEPNNEEISIFNFSPNKNHKKNSSIRNRRKTRKNISENGNEKNQNDEIQKRENRARIEADSFTEDIFTISGEENKIFSNSQQSTSILKGNGSFLEKKANSINYSGNNENFRHPSEFNETERKKLKKTSKASHTLLKSKQIKKRSNKNSQSLRNYQKVSTNNNKLSKLPKMNIKKIMNSTDSLKNQSRNAATKKVTASTFRQMVITASPLLVSENKLNLSHQLFCESREQECINILDLKSDEEGEVCAENQGQEEKFKIENQLPEKHFTPKNQSLELAVFSAKKEPEHGYVMPKNDSQIQINKLFANAEKTLKGNNSKKTNCILKKNGKDENEIKQELVHLTENETSPISNNFKNNDAVNCSTSSQRSEVHIKDALKCGQEKKSGNSVFKQLSELSFNENGSGCSAVQCWSVNNVKCGVFKLKIKAHLECQTLHSTSHLGGVLVKGHLRMKIGNKKQDLNEGDMVFVPPLTEWRATNIGQCESVFYYWCGRFGS